MLAGATWNYLFEVDRDSISRAVSARLPVPEELLTEYLRRHSAIHKASWADRGGLSFIAAPLDGSVPTDLLKSLIDEAYELMSAKMDDRERLRVDLVDGIDGDDLVVLDRLIDAHKLTDQREEIHGLARRAILMRTSSSTEDIAIGASKLRGEPDLPYGFEWPELNGRPLAFLAQIDMREAAKLGASIDGLPKEGLLSLFSAWAWVDEDGGGPQILGFDVEEMKRLDLQGQPGWTIVLHTPPSQPLTRRPAPKDTNPLDLPPAGVELTPLTSLPSDRREPTMAALKWSDELHDRFAEMESDFKSVLMARWLGDMDSLASHHLLGGYATFQQQFPMELAEDDRAMLLQIGTDDKINMWWGDGGNLIFYVDADALDEGRFERLWCDCQGG
ncbi:MAG: YwqG family protein [Patescibacteria group bacterium]|nr:YwqG family protein [Patescibacteria group bacterium]